MLNGVERHNSQLDAIRIHLQDKNTQTMEWNGIMLSQLLHMQTVNSHAECTSTMTLPSIAGIVCPLLYENRV